MSVLEEELVVSCTDANAAAKHLFFLNRENSDGFFLQPLCERQRQNVKKECYATTGEKDRACLAYLH